MAAVAQKVKLVSIAAYLAFEEISEVKHEFHNGKIIEIHGGSAIHSRISVQISYALLLALEKKNISFSIRILKFPSRKKIKSFMQMHWSFAKKLST